MKSEYQEKLEAEYRKNAEPLVELCEQVTATKPKVSGFVYTFTIDPGHHLTIEPEYTNRYSDRFSGCALLKAHADAILQQRIKAYTIVFKKPTEDTVRETWRRLVERSKQHRQVHEEADAKYCRQNKLRELAEKELKETGLRSFMGCFTIGDRSEEGAYGVEMRCRLTIPQIKKLRSFAKELGLEVE